MFNLLAVRASTIPRLTRLLGERHPESDKLAWAEQLEHERIKAKRGDMENALRRHNLLPAVFEMLRALGQSGGMGRVVEEAQAKGRERRKVEKPEEDLNL